MGEIREEFKLGDISFGINKRGQMFYRVGNAPWVKVKEIQAKALMSLFEKYSTKN